MAINDSYNQYLGEIIETLAGDQSFIEEQDKQIEIWFNKYGFTNEQMAQVMAQSLSARMQYVSQFASAGAIELIKEERAQALADKEIEKIDKQIELLDAQIEKEKEQKNLIVAQELLIARQEEGYDDNMLVKAGEFQGGLASFAVNANSDSAQDAIDNFLETINEMKARVGYTEKPDITINTITSTSIELDWFPIDNASGYNVYVDGELNSFETVAGTTITGLVTATQYAIVVTAVVDGIESSTKNEVLVTTL